MRELRLRLAIGIAVLDTVLLLTAIILETREHIHAGPSPHWLAFVELAIVLGYGAARGARGVAAARNPVPWFLLYFATHRGPADRAGVPRAADARRRVDGARWLAWVTDWMVSPAFATLYVLCCSSSRR